jgi:hypothetical protein
VKSDEARFAVELSHQLSVLASYPEWRVLVDYVQKTEVLKQSYLLNGGCRNIEEYKKISGWLEGVHFVLDAAKTTEDAAVRARPYLNKGE